MAVASNVGGQVNVVEDGDDCVVMGIPPTIWVNGVQVQLLRVCRLATSF